MKLKTLVTAVVALLATASVLAAEIKVLASNGVREALHELAPAFERESGHKLVFGFAGAAALKRRMEGGEAFDLAIIDRAGIEDLAKQGKVDGASRAAIARSGVGIGIRKGAPRPDIGTTDALKRTLLAAKSISWAKEGQSGMYFASMLERIGIAGEIRPKYQLAGASAEAGKLVAAGKAELAVGLLNELMVAPGVEVLGPLPPELLYGLRNYASIRDGKGCAILSDELSQATSISEWLALASEGASRWRLTQPTKWALAARTREFVFVAEALDMAVIHYVRLCQSIENRLRGVLLGGEKTVDDNLARQLKQAWNLGRESQGRLVHDWAKMGQEINDSIGFRVCIVHYSQLRSIE